MSDQEITQERDMTSKPDDEREEGTNEGQASISSRCQGAKRDGQYEYLGKAAARLDDVLNALPARLTALLIIALAPLFGGNRFTAWQIWRRDAHRTASPNAGHPMAAAAGALGLQLEKVGHYRLGDNDKVITASSVRQAERMVWSIGCVVVFLTAVVKTFWSCSVWVTE